MTIHYQQPPLFRFCDGRPESPERLTNHLPKTTCQNCISKKSSETKAEGIDWDKVELEVRRKADHSSLYRLENFCSKNGYVATTAFLHHPPRIQIIFVALPSPARKKSPVTYNFSTFGMPHIIQTA